MKTRERILMNIHAMNWINLDLLTLAGESDDLELRENVTVIVSKITGALSDIVLSLENSEENL